MPAPLEVPGFEVDHLIARGGMAAVYLAKQKTLGRQVALKIMDSHDDESFAERFLNEGRLIASLSHPNVITIHDLGLLDDGRAFISMEFIDGGDLEERLRQPMSEDDAVEILRNLTECLQYIHENDVVHRDIKPANILFRKDGTLVLTDFGIAKQVDKDIKLTRDGVAVGSPGYMSPEQAQAHEVDGRTDIYSVGVIFSEMLLGQNTYEADSHIQTSMNHIQMDIPRLPSHLAHYQDMLDKMLAKNPNDRFESAQSLLNYIEMLPYMDELPDLDQLPELDDPMPTPQAAPEPVAVERATYIEPEDDDIPFIDEPPAKKRGLFGILARNDSLIFGFILLAFIGSGVYFFKEVKVVTYISSAEKAFKNDRLMLPEDKSAYYYYTKALELDPKNEKALAGIQLLADRYAALAEKAGDKTKKANYIERGLTIDPNHEKLLQLRKNF